MVNNLKIAFDKYFNTLANIGYISPKERDLLLVVSFLKKYIYSTYTSIDADKIKIIHQIFDCLLKQSCTIESLPSLYYSESSSSGTTEGSVLTQQSVPVITVSGDSTVVTQSGTTQMFSDFAYQSSLGSEDYLAGYDSALNQNIRVNAGSLVLTWQPI